MGIRARPLKFKCRACRKNTETPNVGNKGMFCNKECRANFERKGINGARRHLQNGYVMLSWTEPGGTKLKANRVQRFEHRVVWQEHFGEIPRGSIIHHKNEIKTDNRIENLELMSRLEHTRHHLCKWPDRRDQLALYAKRAREKRAARKMAK